ncbi:MAG: hypothetical protein ABEJ93_01675 [Candidatus Nanohalobium sp.]
MTGEKRRKLSLTALISTLFLPPAAAQDVLSSGGVQESFLKFANSTIIFFEVSTPAEVILYFIAPIAGFYFIQKNILNFSFELFEERIGRHTYHRTDEDIPNGLKGLSLVTAFILVQTVGMMSAGILLALGLFSLLLAGLMHFGLLEGALQGGNGNNGGNNTGGGNNGGGDGGNTGGGNNGGGRNVDWRQIGQDVGNFLGEVGDARQRRAERSIESALSVFNSGTDIIDLIDREPSDFRDHLRRIKNARKDDAEDLNSLEGVLDRMKDVEDKMKDMKSYLAQDLSNNNDWASSKIRKQWDGWNKSGVNPAKMLRKTRKDLKRIKSDQENTSSTFEDQLDKSWKDIQIYVKIHTFSERLPKKPDRVANDSNLLSRLAEEARDRGLAGGRSQQQAMSDFKNALEKLGRFESAHKNLIEEFESELQKELKIDQSDGEELNRISNKDKEITLAAERVKERLENAINSSGSASPSKGDVETKLGVMKDLGEQIGDQVQDIYSIVDQEGEFENETYKKLKELT